MILQWVMSMQHLFQNYLLCFCNFLIKKKKLNNLYDTENIKIKEVTLQFSPIISTCCWTSQVLSDGICQIVLNVEDHYLCLLKHNLEAAHISHLYHCYLETSIAVISVIFLSFSFFSPHWNQEVQWHIRKNVL